VRRENAPPDRLVIRSALPQPAFQRHPALGHRARDARALAAVDLGLVDPIRADPDRPTPAAPRVRALRAKTRAVLLVMLHLAQVLEQPTNPARFSFDGRRQAA